MEKVVVVVGASFAGLCAVRYILHNQYSHGFSSDGKNGKCKLKIILLDCKDYFEYYPSTIRSLITSDVSTVIKLSSLPEINHPCVTFICGKFTSLDHVSKIITYVSSNLTSGTIKFDCLLLSHGMFYNQPIKPSATFPTYASRLTEISTYREKLLRCSKIVVLGGGLIGVEYVADLVDFMNHYKKKVALLLVTRGKYLLTDLPPSAGLRARRYLEEKDVNIIFNATVSTVSPSLDCVMFKDSMCDPIHCDLVINCTGMNFSSSRTSSEMSTSETKDSIITTYESGFANRHLECVQCSGQGIFCAGDNVCFSPEDKVTFSGTSPVSSHSSSAPPIRNAHIAEGMSQVAAHNMLQYMSPQSQSNLWRFPENVFSAHEVPVVACISLGWSCGIVILDRIVLGGGNRSIVGLGASLLKKVIEITKIAEIRGKFYGRWFWILAHAISNMLHATLCLFHKYF